MNYWIMHPENLTPQPGEQLTTPEHPAQQPLSISSSITDTLLNQNWNDALSSITPLATPTPTPTPHAPGRHASSSIKINWTLNSERTTHALRSFTKQLTRAAFQQAGISLPHPISNLLNSHRLEHHAPARAWHQQQPRRHPDPTRRYLLTLIRHALNGDPRHAALAAHRHTLQPHAPNSEAWRATHQRNNNLLKRITQDLHHATPNILNLHAHPTALTQPPAHDPNSAPPTRTPTSNSEKTLTN